MDLPAFQFDMQPAIQRLYDELERMIAALPMFGLALLVLVAGWLVGGWLSRRAVLDRVARRNQLMRELVRTSVRWIALAIALVIALEVLDATALVGAVLGTAGVLGVALGFAFKDILENYLAGLLMSLRQPFAPRDHVVIEGHEGVVVRMTSRATILMTLDGNHVRLPNAMVFRSVTLNYSRNPSRRFEFDVGVGVGEDLLRAQAIGRDVMARHEGVMDDPAPRAFITALGDSNVQVRFQGWVDQRTHDFLQVQSEAIRTVKLALEAAGMDLPEPIYRVQLAGATPITPGAASARAVPAEASSERPDVERLPADDAPRHVDAPATTEIDRQIDREGGSAKAHDLLDPGAPRE
jgi:small-conductance mechanosensitive channel